MRKSKYRVVISKKVYDEIKATIGTKRAETGGLLFGTVDEKNKIIKVEKFAFDQREGKSHSYTMNSKYLNPIITFVWNDVKQEVVAMIHSHPDGSTRLSSPDFELAKKYIERFELNAIFMPVVQSSHSNSFKIFPYVVEKVGNRYEITLSEIQIVSNEPELEVKTKEERISVEKTKLEIPKKNSSSISETQVTIPEITISNSKVYISEKGNKISIGIENKIEEDKTIPPGLNIKKTEPPKPELKPSLSDFSRIQDAVSLNIVRNFNILGVGAGGAFHLYQNLVRSGFQNFSTVDFDKVEPSNLVRQGYFPEHVGLPKVLALENELRRLNPDINFQGIDKSILELPEELEKKLYSKADILLFLTDSFKAQAYGNRMAIKYKKPAIWAGFYKDSLALEVFFYIPGVTPGCFRCAVSSRYAAQQKKMVKISSNSNTIFHSDFLDAIIGKLVLAISHNKTEGFIYSNWFGEYFDKNLLQIRVNPSYKGIIDHAYPENSFGFNFEAVWQKIEPECPQTNYDYTCPDCHADGLKLVQTSSKLSSLNGNKHKPKRFNRLFRNSHSELPNNIGTWK